MEVEKPKCKLIGENGNVFNLGGLVKRALQKAGMKDKADEFGKKMINCHSYEEALCLMMDYVDVE